MRTRVFGIAAALLSWGALAQTPPRSPEMVTDEPVLAPVSTHHVIRAGTARLPYTATFAELPLEDPQGRLQATISATAYVLDSVRDRADRPVVFLFNGGPGASSSPLHFGAFGPRRLTDERDAAGQRRMVDNAYTLLDVADLVFIDPVGTGLSRERPGAAGDAYWSVAGDAAATLKLIHTWLEDNGRRRSPLFIAGESYGGFRLATLLEHATDLNLAGLLFISPMLDASAATSAPGNDLPYVFDLPSMAVAAWEQRRIERAGRSLQQIYAEAEHFALTDYALALLQGAALPAAERERLARRMAGLIGLPAAAIAAANLRIDSQDFLEQLLAGRIVGRLDTRIAAPRPDPAQLPNRPAAANDPALGLGASNVIKSEPIKAYLRDELGVRTARDYLSLSLDVNFRWDWQTQGPAGAPRFYVNPTANIAKAMSERPRLRVLLVGGYYDMAVPLLAPRYALLHAGLPMDRVSMQAFVAPHSAFQGEAALAHGCAVVHDFIRGATAAALAPADNFDILITPSAVSQDNLVKFLDLEATVSGLDVAAGQPLFTLPLVFSNVESEARKLSGVTATDAAGEIALTQKEQSDSMNWVTHRAVHGTVTLRYRVPIDNAPQARGSGPPLGLRSEAGGFSGVGRSFVLMPATAQRYHVNLRWDLANLGPGARAMSSLTDSNVADAYFMAGALHVYPAEPPPGGFAAAWLGEPPFAAAQVMAWTGKLNAWYTHFFGGDPARPYRVFMRSNPVNPGGGVGLPSSFVATFDGATRADRLQLTLAHEMLHTWGPRLQPEGLQTQWFPEGTAVFYQRVLPLRAGLLSPARFLEDLNESAARYYTNSMIAVPNEEIGKHFWEDTRIRVLPYDRGSFYFALVNAQIRKASSGRHSLDDLILELVRRERRGEHTDTAGWVALVARELGTRQAQATYDAMLAGEVMLPDSDAFGPCFERTTASFRRFELGFDGKSLTSQPRRVQGLVSGSAAAAAGLREGDEILQVIGLDAIQSDQQATVTWHVRRNGTVVPITYLPRGASADAYQWRRVPGVPDRKCGV